MMKTRMKATAFFAVVMILSARETMATNPPKPTTPTPQQTQVVNNNHLDANAEANAHANSSSRANSTSTAYGGVSSSNSTAHGGNATAYGGEGGKGGSGGNAAATVERGAVTANPTATATIAEGAVRNTVAGGTSSVTGSGNSTSTNDNRSSATGGSVSGSGNSSASGGTVSGSGNSSVTVVDASETLNVTPHAPFVSGVPTPTLFEHKMSQSGVSLPYLVEMARVCPPTFGASRDMRPQDEKGASRLSNVTSLSYRPGAFGKARDSGPPVGVLEVGGFTGTQRFRCLGRVSAEGAPKKAEKAFFDTLMYDASEFTSRRVRASRVYLLFDRCTVSTSNGVMTFGRGMGASGGASDVFDSALATLNGGVSIGSGRTLTFTQVGVTFIAVEPTDDTGPGTFTLADLQPKVAQTGTTTPSGMAKPGDLAQPLSGNNMQ